VLYLGNGEPGQLKNAENDKSKSQVKILKKRVMYS